LSVKNIPPSLLLEEKNKHFENRTYMKIHEGNFHCNVIKRGSSFDLK